MHVKYVEITLLTVSGYLTSINNKRLNTNAMTLYSLSVQ